MKKSIAIGLLQLLLCSTLFSQDLLCDELMPVVQSFINAFKNNNKNEIVKQIEYPFYFGINDGLNIKPINNENEMINKIGLVFDQKLIDEIANSSAQDDWQSFGWRGIYFLRERVIIDYDGKLYRCFYKTKDRIELEDKLLTNDRNNLYEPLRNFRSNIGSYVSKTYNIRLDKMDDNSIRCIFWNKQQTQSEEPVFILLNGNEYVEGSIGNTYIIFKNNSRIYILYVGNAWQIERYDIGIYVDRDYEFIESYFVDSKYCLFGENMDMIFME